jgi:hypothetical protein
MVQIIQIKRTEGVAPPAGLLPGELAIEMNAPNRLWVGVPAAIDASQRKLLFEAGAYVLKAGDTMTGDLTIAKAHPALHLNKTAGTDNYIYGEVGGLVRWTINPGDSIVESGGNVGSNFALNAFNDAGVFLYPTLTFLRSTGLGTVRGDPTDPLGIATKQYVDNALSSGSTVNPNFTGTIVASVAANALTIAVKTAGGADPSPGSPVKFRVPTESGGFIERQITAALSIVVPSGAQIGVVNAQPFRIWVALFDDAGTPRLAVRNNVSFVAATTFIDAPPEHRSSSATILPGNNAGTWYAGAAIATKFWAYIGHLTWEAGLVATGLWAAAPTLYTLVGAHSRRPGDVVQTRANRSTATAALSVMTLTDSTLTVPWASYSAANLVEVLCQNANVYLRTSAINGEGVAMLRRDSTTISGLALRVFDGAATGILAGGAFGVTEMPMTTAAVTYKISFQNSQAALVNYAAAGLMVRELMA